MTLRSLLVLALLAVAPWAGRAFAAGDMDEPRDMAAPASAPAPLVRGGRPPEPPPPPSDPPVTRDEAAAVLDAIVAAYRREDPGALEKLHATEKAVAFKAVRDAKRLFASRNAIVLRSEILEEEREPDGGLALTVLVRTSSRAPGDLVDRSEKQRWRISFARRPGLGVVIASQSPFEAGLLPADPPWANPEVSGEIRLQGARQLGGAIALDLVLRLVNVSGQPQSEVPFALHPFSSAMQARQGETVLQAERREASLDAWIVRLSEPVEPGGAVDLGLSYELSQPGDVAAAAIGPDVVRLLAAAAWLPLVEPPRRGQARRSHDLVVVHPEGIVASMPGRRSDEEAPGAGLRAVRFVSEFPFADAPLVALAGTLQEVRLGPSLVLEVLREKGGGDPATAISHVTTLAAFLEDRLGACPVGRIALAESLDGGFREAPGWMALPSLHVPRGDAHAPVDRQAFFFLSLSMARLWVLHAREPAGLGARDVAGGLCEHLAGRWAGAVVDEDIPGRQRDDILAGLQADPELDRPLLPLIEDPGTPALFKEGKARIVFDMFERLVGEEEWLRVLKGWAAVAKPGAGIELLVSRMEGDALRDAFVETFFRRQGACQIRIKDMRLVPLPEDEASRRGLDPGAWKQVEIELENQGAGPVPVDVTVEIDQALRHERVIAPDSGTVVLGLVAAALPTRVRLDPERILWQSRGDDDTWPVTKRRKRDELDAAIIHGRSEAQPGTVRDRNP